jgi:hypothetical protein
VIGANSLALAQPFPSKPLCIVAPFPPSGSVESCVKKTCRTALQLAKA